MVLVQNTDLFELCEILRLKLTTYLDTPINRHVMNDGSGDFYGCIMRQKRQGDDTNASGQSLSLSYDPHQGGGSLRAFALLEVRARKPGGLIWIKMVHQAPAYNKILYTYHID